MKYKPKPILIYNNKPRKLEKYTQPMRGIQNEVEDDIDKNYQPKVDSFRQSIANFNSGQLERQQNRNPKLIIPVTIDHIVLKFHDYFDCGKFENAYRTQFGLTAIAYEEYHTKAIFAIADKNLFSSFIKSIDAFIKDSSNSDNYSNLIKYIINFDYYGSGNIKRFNIINQTVHISLMDSVELYSDLIFPLKKSILSYCEENNLDFRYDEPSNTLELNRVDKDILNEIVDNFDIIHTINSFSSAIVKPSEFNLKEVTYGFEINNIDLDLPTVGIIDTGINSQSPLGSLIVNSNYNYDLTETGSHVDIIDHGTGVACFAVLGRKLIPDHRKSVDADARLVSIKIMDDVRSSIFQNDVVDLIKNAHIEFGTKIFVLTIGYVDELKYNSDISDYAYILDHLAYELDILIFISIGNASYYNVMNGMIETFPDFHDDESTNLNSPADSFNNITIGAVAGNFEGNGNDCYSINEFFPTIYSRTNNIDWSHLSVSKRTRKNKQLFKPDVVHFAGDIHKKTLDSNTTGIKILSSNPAHGYNRDIGTSFSAPLVANIAAKLLRLYPTLYNNIQSVKALIINGCFTEKIEKEYNNLRRINFKSIYGNGIPADDNILYNNETECTFIIEDKIKSEELNSYSLKLPEYFLGIYKTRGIISVRATLCFKFRPISRARLTYCPIHISFGLFKDQEILAMNKMKTDEYRFGPSWSQDYYYKAKMLSNVQSLDFNVPYSAMVSENCTFQIAVQCKLHKLLTDIQKNDYKGEHEFSLVVTIKDLTDSLSNGDSLYNEMISLNNLDALADLEIDLEV